MKTKIFILPLLLVTLLSVACEKSESDLDYVVGDLPEITFDETATKLAPDLFAVDETQYTRYYFDAESGDDANDGLSESTPYKSLAMITAELLATERVMILLKCGTTFDSQSISLTNVNSSEDFPLIIDSYGAGDRPMVASNSYQCVTIECDNVRIRNIAFTNPGGYRGIYIIDENREGAHMNIEITGCRFEYINWQDPSGVRSYTGIDPSNLDVESIASNYSKEYGGIFITVDIVDETNPREPRWYENLYITNNEFYQCCRTGVLLNSRDGCLTDSDLTATIYPSKNVVIKGNKLEYIGGDGVVIMGAEDVFIESNKLFYANFLGRSGNASAGLWPFKSTNTYVQYNEVGYTQWDNGSGDAEGLDIDHGNKNTYVQYNYIHHNEGGGILLCATIFEHTNSLIRNNIFYRNGGSKKGSFMNITSEVTNVKAYNNLVVLDNVNKQVIYNDDWYETGNAKNIELYNNIFYSVEPTIGVFQHECIENFVVSNNLYYNLGDLSRFDPSYISFDPEIMWESVGDGFGYDEMLALLRPANSNIYKCGTLFDGMLPFDIMGLTTLGKPYVGPYAE
ncbi:MAG: right-handed parallel beta-helix repeat-containing protein [Rikenellaceae bacterium]